MTHVRQGADCHCRVFTGEIVTWKPDHFGGAHGGRNWCASGECLTAMKLNAGGLFGAVDHVHASLVGK